MNEDVKAPQPETRGTAFALGLNPYGLTYHLGLQGAGGPRVDPGGAGLEGFIAIAAELGAEVLEIYDPWLRFMSDDELGALRDRLAGLGMTPVVGSGLMMGPFESALRSARALDAQIIRYGLTTVLCGDRHAHGDQWQELVAQVRAALADRGPRAFDDGRTLAIENHQDFGSEELADFCESTRGVGICLDTGNTFPVAEAPLDFTRRVASHVRHVHLKDYRVQFTDEGYRLVRCAIGDGAVPIAAMLDNLGGARPEADGGARARSARGAACAVPAAGMVEFVPAEGGVRFRRLPRRGEGQSPRRRCRLSHALGARRRRRDRRLRTGYDSPQRPAT